MPEPVADQVVVIVGASTGIGRATALAFAAEGARVVCASRGTLALETLAQQIRRDGGDALPVPTDVADAASVRSLAQLAEQHYGRIDTWVNAAAVGVVGRVEDITDEEFDRVMRVNFLGHVHGVHAALPALRRSAGTVIGISAVEGVRAVPLQGPYTASKFALQGFYDCLRLELAQDGAPVTVTTILPASTDTPFFEHTRSKLGAMLGPPPPVYAPSVVAASVVYAATHPRREIPVGGSTVAFLLGRRLSPALSDAMLPGRRAGTGTRRADNGLDNLDRPMDGTGRARGRYPGRVLRHSALTRLIGRRRRPGELLTAAVRELRQRRRSARPAVRPAPRPAATVR